MGMIHLDLCEARDADHLAHAVRAVLGDVTDQPDRIKPGHRTPDTFIVAGGEYYQLIVTDHQGPLSRVVALARQIGEEKALELLEGSQPPADDDDEDEGDDDEDPGPADEGPRGPVVTRFAFFLPN